MKTLKKSLAEFLVVLMLLTSVPLQAFTGIELPEWFGAKAEALNVNYCPTVAAQWAKDHWNDYDSIILGAGYWDEGGDCANFVSQCLYMGGLNMNNNWDSSGYWAYYTKGNYGNAGSFINAHNLYNYLLSIGGQSIQNPAAWQISIGDVIFYKTTNDDKMHHSAIVTDIVNGTPVVAAHSTKGTRYNGHAYSLGYSGSRIYLVKMNGSTCVNYNPRSFDVYIASNCGSAGRRCYTDPSPYVGYNFTFSSGEYAHVDRVVYEYGIYFGHTYGYGANGWYEGWIILDNFWYQRHVDSATVTHIMGGWYVESNATCTTQGVKKNVCSRCGYTETQNFGPNGHNWANATCTSAKYCRTCGTTSGTALGHSWGDWITTKSSTCVQNGVKTRTCNRCGKTESQNLNISDHTWGSWAVKTPATCLNDGLDNRFCKVCNLEQTRKSNAIGHNHIISETVKSTCTNSGYDIYTCTRCGDSYTDTVDALGHLTGENGDIIEFGSYPQSKVTDADLINELQSKLGLMQSYGYYEGTGVRDDGNMKLSYLMEHGTVYHNGNKYEVVSISSYRPSNVGLTSESNYQEANGYDRGGEMYWFKYEPIKWRIIDKSKGLVICESILDSQPYNDVLYLSDGYYWNSTADKKYYANDWKNSTLREWLNDDFYNTAFSEEEKKVIDITNVETSEYSDTNSGYIYKPSSDNIFLLSYQELTDSAYGFTNSNRIIRGTDYAKSQGLYCLPKDNGYYGNHYWYTRTPGANSADLYRVGYDGSVAHSYTGTNTDNTYYGIVPAFCFDVSSGILGSCVKAKEPTCTESGNTEGKRCLRCDAILVASEEIPALGHDWGETVKVEPTCLDKGSITQSCNRCGITGFEEIDALGHDFDVTLVMPTCTKNGTSTSICSRCSHTEIIDTGWTPWTDEFTEGYFVENGIPASMYEVKSKYRYRDKEITIKESYSAEEQLEGWELLSTDKEYGQWGDAIGPVYSDPGSSDTRMSWSENGIIGYEQKTQYRYYRYTNEAGTAGSSVQSSTYPNPQVFVLDYKLVNVSTSGGFKAYIDNDNFNTVSGKYITLWLESETQVDDPNRPIYGPCWYYKDRQVSYIYKFWRWNEWSEWSLTKPTESNDKEVDVYTVSRVNLDALGHQCDEEWELTKLPTCTEKGEETAKCIRYDDGKTCDKTYIRYIEAVGHSLVKTDEVAATCLTDGNSEYYTCLSCEKYFADGEAEAEIEENSWRIPAYDHNEGKWICIDEGYEDFVAYTKEECNQLIPKCGYSLHFELHCTRCINEVTCDAILDEHEITAKDHEMSECERKEATCLEGGYIVKKCNYCDYTESEILDKAEHNWSDWTTIKESSCVHPGEEERHCTNECDAITVEYNVLEAEATEHNYVEAETITSDCQVGTDLIHYICNRCGETDCESCNNINKPHHYWNGDPAEHNISLNKDKTVAPTCVDQGLNVYMCINDGCSYGYTETVNALGHDCTLSKHIDYTCTESGYDIYICCREGCAYTYNVYSADCPGHDYSGEYKVKTKADCVSEGLKELSCIRINHGILCNEKLDDQKISKRDHRWSEWQAISQATCEVDGLEKRDCQNTVEDDEYKSCVAYEENILKAIGHKWDNGVINPESTCKIHGTKTYTCQNDNSHKKTESVALNPNNHVGETYIKDAKTENCTEDGYTGDKYCSDCNALLESGEPINKLSHDMSKWNSNNDATHTRECQRDNGCTYTETQNCSFGDWIVTKEATCTEKGLKERVCTVCGYKETAEIEFKEHAPDEAVIENRVAPKCEEKGSYDQVVYCTECPKELSREEKEIPATGHDWDNGVIDPESTCKIHGTKTYTCQNDNSHKKTESVAINPNNHVGETYIKDAKNENCTEDGYTGDKYCSDCDALLEKGKAIVKLGHNMGEWSDNNNGTHTRECQRNNGCTYKETNNCTFGNWIVTKEATCTEKGLKERVCIVCGYKETATIEIKAHTPGEVVTENRVDPKCEVKGSYDEVVYCTECTKELSRVKKDIPAIGHDWDNGVIDPESTCKIHGTKTYTCQNDNSHKKTESVALNPNNHVGENYIKDAKTEICTEDGYTGDKYCSDCNALLESGEVINKLGHDMSKWNSDNNAKHTRECQRDNGCTYTETENCSFGEWVVTKEATCTGKGSKERTCTVCGYKEIAEIELKAHIPGEAVIENKVAPKCEEKGSYDEVVYCTECPKEISRVKKDIEPLDHDWGEWKVSKDATIDAKGEEKRVCKRDSSHIETRETEKLIAYTAYFIKANENGAFEYNGKKYDLVDTVRFAEGTTVIVNPDVPEEEGFIGYWEDYTLRNENIYIEAIYELKSSDNQSDLKSDKDVVYKDGVATITLSAFAETLNAKVPMGATPVDIILVLDQSSSMTSNKIGKETRLAVLKRVAKDFVTTVYESAVENEVDHRVAMVSFSGTKDNCKGTGLIGVDGKIKTFKNLKDSDYANAFIDVNGNLDNLKTGVDSLTGISGTSSDYGLQMARQILANNQDGREKLVLFITDGEPGDPGRNMGAFNYTVANDAIDFANQIKNDYSTTIYSIGVAAGASPSDETNKINKFLHYVSSNYPEAKDMNNKGTAATMKNYFLSAEDAEEIEAMFESIVSRQIVNTISFTKVNFYDTVSEYFTLTTENENALRESVKSEYGVSDSDIIITRNADGTTTVRINNLIPKAVFDDNNVQTGYGATVKFDVTANEKTLEGGTFVTNTEDAGIENGGKTVIEFKMPDGKEISSGRAIVEFRIGDEVYAIREVSIGDKVIVPETDVADWVVTDGTTITSDYTVFNTEYTSETRTVKWIIDGVTKEETYHIGEIIFAPQFNNPDGKLFKGWNAKVPYRMPDYDLEFTAVFEAHEHDYKQTAKSGECTTGVTYTYTCDCGDEYAETKTCDDHSFTANVQLVNDESVATMTCTVCGKADSKVISYKAQYEESSWWNTSTKVVALTLYDNDGITVQPDGYIYIKLNEDGAVLSNAKSGKLIVMRVNEDGSEDNIPYLKNSSVDKTGYYVDGNYIVLKLDHFSYYALILPEDATNVPTYGEIECAFNGHSYTSKVTAPTCTVKGYTTHTCTSCGDVYTDSETSALGHKMSAYVVTKEPTCTDKGTEMSTCNVCTHTETRSINANGHNYKDGMCTGCGKNKVENCTHMCHKGGFMGFIWKIVRFFWKLFRMNPICECGVKHY